MRENTKQTMIFKEFLHKKVEVDFDGGEITSDAGLLFLRETESQIGIIANISKVLKDKRNPAYIKHTLPQLLTQRVFQIAAGYEDSNDCNKLKDDPILKMACGKEEALASQPTMSRFENSPSRTTLYRIAQALADCFIGSYENPPQGIIVDIDDTADPLYGAQQQSLFNAYHGCHCYMPIHIYEGGSGKLITTILRPGKRPSGKEIVAILKRIVGHIRQSWPDVGIILRGDAHYSCPEVFDYCEENNLKYVLGFKSYPTVTEKAVALSSKAKEHYERSQKGQKLYGEFMYQAGSWSKPNRIIVKAEYNSLGANTRFIVTNLTQTYRKFVYETVYCMRGAMELMIKEHKNHLLSDRTSCSGFAANQFRLFLHSIAYILIHTLRERHLKNTMLAKAQFNTIRLKLFKIGARVRYLRTKIKIHLPSACPMKLEYLKAWESCCRHAYP
jgi:hypothetical protein